MHLTILPGDGQPLYRQIMRQLTDALATGRITAGDKLPSHRELAEELVVSHLTVKKAYEELEREGWIHTQRGRGTFASERRPDVDPEERRERLREDARRLAAQARLNGVPIPEVQSLLIEVDSELEAERATHQEGPST